MKKSEIALYLVASVILAILKLAEIIDEASIAWAIGVIGLIRGLVYQKEKINALKHDIEQREELIKTLRKK